MTLHWTNDVDDRGLPLLLSMGAHTCVLAGKRKDAALAGQIDFIKREA